MELTQPTQPGISQGNKFCIINIRFKTFNSIFKYRKLKFFEHYINKAIAAKQAIVDKEEKQADREFDYDKPYPDNFQLSLT
jgi:hypothetical protein